jgi:two-component system chemotaxis response regulator CheB
VYHAQKPPLRTSVIVSNAPVRRSLVAELSNDPRLRLIADFGSLADAYAPTEAAPPELVVCSKDIILLEEFAMFQALIGIVGGQIVSVNASGGAAAVIRALGLPTLAQANAPTYTIEGASSRQRLVAIGASTGGIEALSQILASFPANCPPTVVVQHIKPDFLDSVVARLNRVCAASVQTGVEGQKLQPGQVVFAPGLPSHMEVDPKSLRCKLREGPPISGHRPSIDVMFQSIVAAGAQAVGVILTGMGRDGARGLGAMRRAGAWTIGQDEATSTVFGMPRVAQEEQAVCEVLPLPRIGKAILAASVQRKRKVQQ